jgi:alpha-galactosidase/6-phospho-beta-glucosidase family protein
MKIQKKINANWDHVCWAGAIEYYGDIGHNLYALVSEMKILDKPRNKHQQQRQAVESFRQMKMSIVVVLLLYYYFFHYYYCYYYSPESNEYGWVDGEKNVMFIMRAWNMNSTGRFTS